jgi:hypothetical protein
MFYSSVFRFAFAVLLILSPAADGLAIGSHDKRQDGYHWINTWTSMPQLVEPNNMPPSPFVCEELYGDHFVSEERLT